jgi:hypothetical protein
VIIIFKNFMGYFLLGASTALFSSVGVEAFGMWLSAILWVSCILVATILIKYKKGE